MIRGCTRFFLILFLKFLLKIINCFSILFCESCSFYPTMDNGHVMTIFSKIIGKFGQMGRINCRVFPIENSAHILVLCVPSPWFSIYQPLFLWKTKLWRHFKGKFIWVWDMNLGCKEFSHHVSVVVHGFNNKFWKYESSTFKFVFDEK